ncbi:uncharacterized protein BX663DRAFT_544086 [Cokeromyces recurvatus]|uniref:uncharacterized protein n=1 Tax=Cokeromyces recurvatus TaxID=90255 RepID=UPI00221FC16D|nr:uncharacterized protein BX663DRAFT_544086 [Cokeromyces recurvatus]KAI7901297.1 hypothetical protein BX663DRAFT_544086 [Cokeromyces recurvatus]
MGQSPSSSVATSTRHDNASTRTLHSTSINSHRPLSFLEESPTDFIQYRVHTSASSITSSVRRATQEATQAAAAATGPPNLHNFLQQSLNESSRNSIVSSSESTNASFFNDLLSSANNSSLRYLQIPILMQEINHVNDGASIHTNTSSTTTRTSRRMHILVIEYRSNNNNNNNTMTSSPSTTTSQRPLHRFLGLRRPRSEISTTSSTDTIQSMSISINSSQTNFTRQTTAILNQQQSQDGQWIMYILNNNNNTAAAAAAAIANNTALQAFSVSLEENPTYEDLLRLSNILGPARPNTTTQAAVDEIIPVVDWSDDTKKELKHVQCLVCLDEFTLKQPIDGYVKHTIHALILILIIGTISNLKHNYCFK